MSVSDEVHVDDFWLTMESEAIEQAAFPTDIPITRVDASIIAPFIPPLMRSQNVINTEKDKALSHTEQATGTDSCELSVLASKHVMDMNSRAGGEKKVGVGGCYLSHIHSFIAKQAEKTINFRTILWCVYNVYSLSCSLKL